MKALVIDDSATMRHIVADILGGLGFESSQAANGREALDLLESGESFELACIDWNMPVMDGLEFVAAVRARRQWPTRCTPGWTWAPCLPAGYSWPPTPPPLTPWRARS